MVRAGRPYYQLQVTIPQKFEEAVSNFLVEAGSRLTRIMPVAKFKVTMKGMTLNLLSKEPEYT